MDPCDSGIIGENDVNAFKLFDNSVFSSLI